MIPSLYRGFSTINSEITNQCILVDYDLIKRDILNSFMTRKGERVMRPDWGCLIWDYLMDQGPTLQDDIYNECVRIVGLEPRVDFINATLTKYEHGVRVDISLQYKNTNIIDTMRIDFETLSNTAWNMT